jgi:hypothetical protein
MKNIKKEREREMLIEDIKKTIKLIEEKKIFKGRGVAGRVCIEDPDSFHFLKYLQTIKGIFDDFLFILDKNLEQFHIIGKSGDTFQKLSFSNTFLFIEIDHSIILHFRKGNIDSIIRQVLNKKTTSVSKKDNPILDIILSDKGIEIIKDKKDHFLFKLSPSYDTPFFEDILKELVLIGRIKLSYEIYETIFNDLNEIGYYTEFKYNKKKDTTILREIGQEGETIISIPHNNFLNINMDNSLTKEFIVEHLEILFKFKPYISSSNIEISFFDPIDTYLKLQCNIEELGSKIEIYTLSKRDSEDDDFFD